MRKKLFLILVLLSAIPAIPWASPITYTFAGTESGTLNGVEFSNAPITLSLTIDTQMVGSEFPNLAMFSIPGVGSGTITEFTGVLSGPGVFGPSAVTFASDTSFTASVVNPSLSGYDLRSSIGPLVSTEEFPEFGSMETTAGLLALTPTVWTFTATTQPSCQVSSIINGPPRQLIVAMQDTVSGLKSINLTDSVNASVNIPAFSPGTTSPVFVTATKVDQTQSSDVAFLVTNMAGGTTSCDPVDFTLKLDGFAERHVFRSVNPAEHYIRITKGHPAYGK